MSLRPTKTWLALAVVLGLLGALYSCQRFLEADKAQEVRAELLFVPRGEIMKYACGGYREIVADYYWLKAISYIQTEMDGERKYPYLKDVYNLVTDLDPCFTQGYLWGAIFLVALPRDVPEATALLEKGLNCPDNRGRTDTWVLAYWLGQIWFADKGDLETGAEWLERAAAMPGAPDFVGHEAKVLREGRQTRIEKGIYWLDEYEKDTNRIKREVAVNRLLAFLQGGNPQLLEDVRNAYAAAHDGRRPDLLDKLWQDGRIFADPRTGRLRVKYAVPRDGAQTTL